MNTLICPVCLKEPYLTSADCYACGCVDYDYTGPEDGYKQCGGPHVSWTVDEWNESVLEYLEECSPKDQAEWLRKTITVTVLFRENEPFLGINADEKLIARLITLFKENYPNDVEIERVADDACEVSSTEGLSEKALLNYLSDVERYLLDDLLNSDSPNESGAKP